MVNLVERCSTELTAEKLRRCPHTSVREFTADLRTWIDTWNDNHEPYIWAKTATASIGNCGQRYQGLGTLAPLSVRGRN